MLGDEQLLTDKIANELGEGAAGASEGELISRFAQDIARKFGETKKRFPTEADRFLQLMRDRASAGSALFSQILKEHDAQIDRPRSAPHE